MNRPASMTARDRLRANLARLVSERLAELERDGLSETEARARILDAGELPRSSYTIAHDWRRHIQRVIDGEAGTTIERVEQLARALSSPGRRVDVGELFGDPSGA